MLTVKPSSSLIRWRMELAIAAPSPHKRLLFALSEKSQKVRLHPKKKLPKKKGTSKNILHNISTI